MTTLPIRDALRGDTLEISYSTHWGDWCVNHRYYGLEDPTAVRWCTDQPTEADAQRVARNADTITAIVAAHGGAARLRVTFDGDTMIVAEYDWDRWTETADAAA